MMGAGDNTEEKQDIRVGYQVAMNIDLHEEQQMWARSNAMLVANGLIVASLGLSVEKTSFRGLPLLVVVSVAGLLLCVIWCCLIARTAIKATIWVREANRLERGLHCDVRTIESGNAWTSCRKRKIRRYLVKEIGKIRIFKWLEGWLVKWLSWTNKRDISAARRSAVLRSFEVPCLLLKKGMYKLYTYQPGSW